MTHEEIWNLLAIEPSFRERHAPTVRRRLLSAGKAIKKGRERGGSGDRGSRLFFHPVDMSAINQCLHLASTVLLLGTDSDHLKDVVNTIKRESAFRELDPTTIVTSVVLFNLLLEMRETQRPTLKKPEDEFKESDLSPEQSRKLAKDKEQKVSEGERLEQIARRFSELNWMINTAAVEVLNLKWPSV